MLNKRRNEFDMDFLTKCAAEYVTLALAASKHESEIVDFYYGLEVPSELPLNQILERLSELKTNLSHAREMDAPSTSRRTKLLRSVHALSAKLKAVQGEALNFEQEVQEFFQCSIASAEWEFFERELDLLEKLIPGKGSLTERIADYESTYIPKDKLLKAIDYIVNKAKKKVCEFIELPKDDSLPVSLVDEIGRAHV